MSCFIIFLCVKVIFEGVRGQGYQGDIAIDDVQFTVGSCPVLPSGAKPSNPWTTPAVSTVPTTTVPTPGNWGVIYWRGYVTRDIAGLGQLCA